MPRFHWDSRFLSKQGFWALNNSYTILSLFSGGALVFWMKMGERDFCNIFCDEVLWIQCNML